jgi:hypothetical protein
VGEAAAEEVVEAEVAVAAGVAGLPWGRQAAVVEVAADRGPAVVAAVVAGLPSVSGAVRAAIARPGLTEVIAAGR